MRYGLYRVPGVGALPDDVRVDDDGISFPLQETIYRARGCKPLVEDLPGKRITFSDRVLRNSARSTRSRRFRPKPRRHPRRPISLPTIMQSEPNRGVGQLAVKIYKTALYEIYF
jgi:hypothetical protein